MENYILEKISGNARNGSIACNRFFGSAVKRSERAGEEKPLLLGGSWWESELASEGPPPCGVLFAWLSSNFQKMVSQSKNGFPLNGFSIIKWFPKIWFLNH